MEPRLWYSWNITLADTFSEKFVTKYSWRNVNSPASRVDLMQTRLFFFPTAGLIGCRVIVDFPAFPGMVVADQDERFGQLGQFRIRLEANHIITFVGFTGIIDFRCRKSAISTHHDIGAREGVAVMLQHWLQKCFHPI